MHCRIHRLDLCRRVTDNQCPGYDTNQFDGETPILELWGMQSALSFQLLPGLLLPKEVALDWDLSMGQIELVDT